RLTLSVAGLLPAAHQDPKLFTPPDQRRGTSAMRLEAALNDPRAENPPSRNRRGKSLEILRSHIHELELASEEPPGRCCNQHPIRWRKGLQPCCQIRFLPRKTLLLS